MTSASIYYIAFSHICVPTIQFKLHPSHILCWLSIILDDMNNIKLCMYQNAAKPLGVQNAVTDREVTAQVMHAGLH